MKRLAVVLLLLQLSLPTILPAQQPASNTTPAQLTITGFRDSSAQHAIEEQFMKVPDAKLAEQHLRTLTAVPHIAGSPEDKTTADYVAARFREAGLETRIDEYKVWINYPLEISVVATAPPTLHMKGPTREHVSDDPFQNDPRIVMPYNGGSPSGDAEADVVYANYGRPEDFKKLKDMGIDVKGKIVLVRYGQNFRGVKSFVAEEYGAAGVLIYSDPIDDGYFKGDMYPKGPYRPETGVQRGSVQYMFEYPGDPTTPGVASTLSLQDSQRVAPATARNLAKVPTTPLSYGDASPLMENLGGPESPRDWQGALPFTYHVGPGPVKVRMHLKQDYGYRTIWNVVGVVRGSTSPDEWVVSGNHRDAWVFGAVDPNSGTAAMLEAVHGIGALLKTGWKPKRTLVFASWDAEEQGLIGSTEFAEQYAKELENAAAYFNMDVAVSGPNFGSSAVPSLKQFIREVARAVPSPKGGTVYEAWKLTSERMRRQPPGPNPDFTAASRPPAAPEANAEPKVGDLGSGSDYTAFLQHLGVPSTDVGSGGPYGVYHSAFDNFAWFKKFADPTFVYEQQMARIFGIQAIRMASVDVLPYDYAEYGREIAAYIETARKKAADANLKVVGFDDASKAAKRLEAAGNSITLQQKAAPVDATRLNAALRNTERAFLTDGLPNRPWFRHSIYAPGEYTGYAAVVVPGVNEAIDKNDVERLAKQIAAVTAAINRAAETLESYK